MITIVSGFQRCGSSLMLQMLSAGGMRVFHDDDMGYPSFETHHNHADDNDPRWFTSLDGMALKWLEPGRQLPPRVATEQRVIWMRRDFKQQAKSAVKFLTQVAGIPVQPETRRVFAASYKRDEPSVLRAWSERGPVHVQSFEVLLRRPRLAAEGVAHFLGVPLNIEAMVAQVRPRGSDCLPGFLEMELIADAEREHAQATSR